MILLTTKILSAGDLISLQICIFFSSHSGIFYYLIYPSHELKISVFFAPYAPFLHLFVLLVNKWKADRRLLTTKILSARDSISLQIRIFLSFYLGIFYYLFHPLHKISENRITVSYATRSLSPPSSALRPINVGFQGFDTICRLPRSVCVFSSPEIRRTRRGGCPIPLALLRFRPRDMRAHAPRSFSFPPIVSESRLITCLITRSQFSRIDALEMEMFHISRCVFRTTFCNRTLVSLSSATFIARLLSSL